MAANDPCARERKKCDDALNELVVADKAFSNALATEVVPLQTEINKIKLELDGLKKNGDPEGRMPDLEALNAELTNRCKAAKEKPAVKNASAEFNSAKEFVKYTDNKLSDCEKEHKTPSSPKPDTPPASADPDAPTNDSTRGHIPGEWFRP